MSGYLHAPTGMGESGRSMRRTLALADCEAHAVTLPCDAVEPQPIPVSPALFGWPAARADLTISVANADAAHSLRYLLPPSYWAAVERGLLGLGKRKSCRACRTPCMTSSDEIWTPSEHSAAAIRKAVSVHGQGASPSAGFRLPGRRAPGSRTIRPSRRRSLVRLRLRPDEFARAQERARNHPGLQLAFAGTRGRLSDIESERAAKWVHSSTSAPIVRDLRSHPCSFEATQDRQSKLLVSRDVGRCMWSLHRSEGFGPHVRRIGWRSASGDRYGLLRQPRVHGSAQQPLWCRPA
jgi:hypothetical protein